MDNLDDQVKNLIEVSPESPDPLEYAPKGTLAEVVRLREEVANLKELVREMAQALLRSDNNLSLLRYRVIIEWGSIGLPTEYEVDQVIGKSRIILSRPEVRAIMEGK